MTVQDINSDISAKGKNFLQNFFGVNIFSEPDGLWNYEGKFNGRSEHYVFTNDKIKDNYFKKCKALVFEGSGTNFLWEPIPYNEFIPYQIALTIERQLLGNSNMTLAQCVNKYEIKSTTSSFDIKVGNYRISISFGFDRKEIQLTLWTKLVKDELIRKAREEYPNKIIEDPNNVPIIPKEQFLRNFFGIDILNAPDGKWKYEGFRDGKTPYYFFYRNDINDTFFKLCTLFITESGGRMFYWGPSKIAGLEFLEIAAKIHRNLLGEDEFILTDAIREYADVLLNSQGTIEIKFEDFIIQIKHDDGEGTYSMTLWTSKDKSDIVKKIKNQ